MKTTTIHKKVLLLLLFASTVQSANSDQNGSSGQGGGGGYHGSHAGQVHGQSGQDASGIDPAGRIGELCLKNGLSTEAAGQLLTPVRSALAESLPAENIVVKIEEGLAKGVAPLLIAKAAEVRLDYLRRADRLLRFVRSGRGGGGLSRLTSRMALVLEGGLSDQVVENTLKHAGRGGPGRIIRVIDAGAELHKAGLSPEQTQQIMIDCMDRDLNGIEITRALDFILAERAKGRDFEAIYQKLWVEQD